MMYNLPKFDFEKAAKNQNGLKLTKANAVIQHAHCQNNEGRKRMHQAYLNSNCPQSHDS